MTRDTPVTMTIDEWQAKGRSLFGDDKMQWRFKCPSCGHVARVVDWKDSGAPEGAVAFSCIGRWWPGGDKSKTFGLAGGPCTYAGGGLFSLNPVTVTGPGGPDDKMPDVFAFDVP